MAASTSFPSSTADPPPTPSSSTKENRANVDSALAGLDMSQSELVSRIQRLKEDMQSWRMKLDTQFKTYKDELSELKSSLNQEVDQLRSEFQDLRVTLERQQEDVTNSLKTLAMEDQAKEPQKAEDSKGSEDHVEVKKEAVEDSDKSVEDGAKQP